MNGQESPPAHSPVIRFATFEVDLRAKELRRSGLKINLQKQPFQILEMLLERAGELVTREEIRSRIWPAATFVDFEHSVNTAVKKLRQALGDRAENPVFIETLPRQGFRFIAEPRRASPDEGTTMSAGTAAVLPESTLPMGRRLVPWVVGFFLLATILGLWMTWHLNRIAHLSARTIQSVAVLPLANFSGDPSQEFFADGITEALITDLAKIQPLRVTSRTSIMKYKGTLKTAPEIARALGVDAVVEGAVARSGSRVRITAQLIQGSTDRHLWAESYERDLRDVLSLQNEVARAIATEIRGKLTSEDSARLTEARPLNPEAHEAYLKGKYFWNKRSREGFETAVQYFQRAIDIDSNYAAPYAALANCYALDYLLTPPKERKPLAKVLATKALQLDGRLAEAHAVLGVLEHTFYWNWPAAETEYKSAIELNPNYASARGYYSMFLGEMGRFGEALSQAKHASELDPLSLIITTQLGNAYFFSRRYDEALEQYRKVFEMDPTFPVARDFAAEALDAKGLYAQALKFYQQPGATAPETWNAFWKRELSATEKKYARGEPVSLYGAAQMCIRIHDMNRAMKWLEAAYENRDGNMPRLKQEFCWDGLRSHARFKDLLRRMSFTQ